MQVFKKNATVCDGLVIFNEGLIRRFCKSINSTGALQSSTVTDTFSFLLLKFKINNAYY
jgi:hypothetical protein